MQRIAIIVLGLTLSGCATQRAHITLTYEQNKPVVSISLKPVSP